MRTLHRHDDSDSLTALTDAQTKVLTAREERELLSALSECRDKLTEALAAIPCSHNQSQGDEGDGDDEGDETALSAEDDMSLFIQKLSSRSYVGDPETDTRLASIAHRYNELRQKLALANMRLIAHVAKGFRDRGIAYSDLLQEGFCGLLEAIDRFDLTHETKLATYATWWIRQAMQRAVAAGAYPVRLSPRHLRQLAQSHEVQGKPNQVGTVAATDESQAHPSELIQRIHAATRPTVSLDATLDSDSSFSLMQTMSDTETDHTSDVDLGETVNRLLVGLRPREQQVIALRYGLGGKPRLSLSQAGKVLEVSKERVRQIQDRALQKLRSSAIEGKMMDPIFLND